MAVEQQHIAKGEYQYLTAEKLAEIIKRYNTPSSFATKLIRAIFTAEEMRGATIGGANQYRQLDAKRVTWVRNLTLKHKNPTTNKSDWSWWSRIVNSIDSTLRGNSRRARSRAKLKVKKLKLLAKKKKKNMDMEKKKNMKKNLKKKKKSVVVGRLAF